jgi:hypothetical protein
MKIRASLCILVVALSLGACGRSATAPETRSAQAGVLRDGSTTPPSDTTANRAGGGGPLGSGT